MSRSMIFADKILGGRTLILGDVNTGKTTLTRNLLEELCRRRLGDKVAVLDLGALFLFIYLCKSLAHGRYLSLDIGIDDPAHLLFGGQPLVGAELHRGRNFKNGLERKGLLPRDPFKLVTGISDGVVLLLLHSFEEH